MRMVVCAVRDSGVDAFMTPFFCRHVGEAVRGFSDEANSSEPNMVTKHPDDYELFHLGFWESHDASFELLPKPVSLMRGKDAVKG